MHRGPAALAAALLALGAGCSAPALNPDLAAAERAEKQGDYERALVLYSTATRSCHPHKQARRQDCADAYLGRAELLERMGRLRQAAAAYERIPALLPGDRKAAAAGLYRAGRVYLELGHEKRAYRLLWLTLTHYPGEPYAADALQQIVRDGRRRNANQLYQVLGTLIAPLSGTAAGDNLLSALADLAEHDMHDSAAALAFYDKIVREYPASGMRDDALWHGARLARGLGDARGAVDRLNALLATREVAFGAGSYFSVWLDNAQLELGRVLRDDLDAPDRAVAAFSRLPEHYPDSILIDDALWELALTWSRMGNAKNACAALDRLALQPGSKYMLERAPALRRKLACP